MVRGVHLLGRLVCGLASLTIIGAWACEDPPLPMPPPDLGKMEALGPSAETSAKMAVEEAARKTEEQTIVSDGAVRLRWKIPEGEKARAFRLKMGSSPAATRPMKFDRRKQSRLSKKVRRMMERGGKDPTRQGSLTGILRHKDAEYGSLAVDYVLGKLKPNQIPRNRRFAKALKKLQGKVVLSAEIGSNGAVISVDSPLDTDSISADGMIDKSGISVESRYEGDMTLQTIMLEMPAERVRVGDTWSPQLRHFTGSLFEQKKLTEKSVVKLTALDDKGDQVLATLTYDIRQKLSGQWLKLGRKGRKGRKPIAQTFSMTFKGRGVFDASAGYWRSFNGRYNKSGKGLMDFARGGPVTIKPLKKVPEKLLKNL